MDDVKELKQLLVKLKTLLGLVLVGFLFMFYVVDELGGQIRDQGNDIKTLGILLEAKALAINEEMDDVHRVQGIVHTNLKAARDRHGIRLTNLERKEE